MSQDSERHFDQRDSRYRSEVKIHTDTMIKWRNRSEVTYLEVMSIIEVLKRSFVYTVGTDFNWSLKQMQGSELGTDHELSFTKILLS